MEENCQYGIWKNRLQLHSIPCPACDVITDWTITNGLLRFYDRAEFSGFYVTYAFTDTRIKKYYGYAYKNTFMQGNLLICGNRRMRVSASASRKHKINDFWIWLLMAEVESRTQGSRPRPRQGHKKNPRPRPRPKTALPRTDPLEANDRNARGQGQGPRTQAQVFSKKKSLQKIFSGDLKKKSKSLQKFFFRRSPVKHAFWNFFSGDLHNFNNSRKVLTLSRGQANFQGLETTRPRTWPSRPRTSKCVLEDSTSDYWVAKFFLVLDITCFDQTWNEQYNICLYYS